MKNKNFLIRIDESILNSFKNFCFDFYNDKKYFAYFSYNHFLRLCLKSIENNFINSYGKISEPSEEFILFVTKRGSNYLKKKNNQISKINFLMRPDDAALYFRLMQTYFIEESLDLEYYSISDFFVFIVNFIEQNKIKFED